MPRPGPWVQPAYPQRQGTFFAKTSSGGAPSTIRKDGGAVDRNGTLHVTDTQLDQMADVQGIQAPLASWTRGGITMPLGVDLEVADKLEAAEIAIGGVAGAPGTVVTSGVDTPGFTTGGATSVDFGEGFTPEYAVAEDRTHMFTLTGRLEPNFDNWPTSEELSQPGVIGWEWHPDDVPPVLPEYEDEDPNQPSVRAPLDWGEVLDAWLSLLWTPTAESVALTPDFMGNPFKVGIPPEYLVTEDAPSGRFYFSEWVAHGAGTDWLLVNGFGGDEQFYLSSLDWPDPLLPGKPHRYIIEFDSLEQRRLAISETSGRMPLASVNDVLVSPLEYLWKFAFLSDDSELRSLMLVASGWTHETLYRPPRYRLIYEGRPVVYQRIHPVQRNRHGAGKAYQSTNRILGGYY